MAAYVIAQITIHDRARYNRYMSRFMPVLDRYGGRVLAAVEAPEVLEGKWPHEKVILIEFSNRFAAMRWMQSEPYVEIAQDRIAATAGVVILANSLDDGRPTTPSQATPP